MAIFNSYVKLPEGKLCQYKFIMVTRAQDQVKETLKQPD